MQWGQSQCTVSILNQDMHKACADMKLYNVYFIFLSQTEEDVKKPFHMSLDQMV